MPLLQFFKSHNLSEIIQETFIIMVTVNNMPNFVETVILLLLYYILVLYFYKLWYIILYYCFF